MSATPGGQPSANGDGRPVIPPAPLPMVFGIAPVPARRMVLMSIQTPGGTATYFLDVETSKSIGQQLINTATLASSGLHLPKSGE